MIPGAGGGGGGHGRDQNMPFQMKIFKMYNAFWCVTVSCCLMFFL